MESSEFKQLMQILEEIQDHLAEMNTYRFVDHYINAKEFGKLFGITQKTALQWRQSGLLPFAQLGKKIYYRCSNIEALLDAEVKRPKHLNKGSKIQRSQLHSEGESRHRELKI